VDEEETGEDSGRPWEDSGRQGETVGDRGKTGRTGKTGEDKRFAIQQKKNPQRSRKAEETEDMTYSSEVGVGR
jgi:hypothetical protein